MSIVYTVFKISSSEELFKQGFKPVNISADKKLTIVDNHEDIKPTVTDKPIKPDWVDFEISDWPYLTKEEAKQLIRNENWIGNEQ